ncbi:MAG: hypothetical protein ACKOTE_16395 [Opitutaceae bacterium]
MQPHAPRAGAWRAPGLVVVGVILATAFSPRVVAAAPVTGPLVRFTVFGLRPAGEVAFVPKPGAAPQKVQFYPTARSPRYEYRGASPLRFIDPETKAVVAEAAVPPGAGDVLLVFSPAAAGKSSGAPRYDVTILDDSLTRHPIGSLVIVNLSGQALAGTGHDRAVSPEPGANAPIPLGRSAAIRFTSSNKNRVVQAYAGTVSLARDERALLVLFPPFHPGSAEVQARVLVDRRGSGTKSAPRK